MTIYQFVQLYTIMHPSYIIQGLGAPPPFPVIALIILSYPQWPTQLMPIIYIGTTKCELAAYICTNDSPSTALYCSLTYFG